MKNSIKEFAAVFRDSLHGDNKNDYLDWNIKNLWPRAGNYFSGKIINPTDSYQ